MKDIETEPVIETGIEKICKDLLEIGKDYYDLTTGEVVTVIPVDREKYADKINRVYEEDECSMFGGKLAYTNYLLTLPDKEINLEWYSHIIHRKTTSSFVNYWGFNSELYTLVSDVKPNPETGIFTVQCGACGSKNITCNNLEIKCNICGNRKALV